MSLAIDDMTVNGVLLSSGWMDVKLGTFELDAYAFVSGGKHVYQNGGQCEDVCSTGAGWVGTDGHRYSAPLTSILAVRNKRPRVKRTAARAAEGREP